MIPGVVLPGESRNLQGRSKGWQTRTAPRFILLGRHAITRQRRRRLHQPPIKARAPMVVRPTPGRIAGLTPPFGVDV